MSEADIQQDQSDEQPSRRDFLKLAWGTVGVLALAEVGVMTLRFLSPGSAEGEFGGVFTVGEIEDFPVGSVTPFPNGRFYLVRLDDGGVSGLCHVLSEYIPGPRVSTMGAGFMARTPG